MRILGVGLALLLLPLAGLADETVQELVQKAQQAHDGGQLKKAIELLDQALKKEPGNGRAWMLRGLSHQGLERHSEAVTDFTKALEADPKATIGYHYRGLSLFRLGRIQASVDDFDAAIRAHPRLAAGHWQRGIALYYLGRYEEGAKQFRQYESVDTNDVENAVWHFLCVARKEGVARARAGILKIGEDRRVPMMQVYALFRGDSTPADVMKAAQAGNVSDAEKNKRLFYAHLYLGLYAEATGDPKKALEHLEQAVKHPIGHYMWDVARVHRDLLKKK